MRTVICHYHLYKNAGTAFDHVLTASFGQRHLCFDGPFPFFTIDQEQLDRIVIRRPEAVALSSHQIGLPPPVSDAYRLLPILFLRDPFLRIASIYRFKRQGPDGTSTASAAQSLSFPDWVAHCLSDPAEIVHVSNAQTRLVSAPFRGRALARRVDGRMEYDLAQARANLATAAAIGRADHFDTDIPWIAELCAGHGLPLVVPRNLTRNATDTSPDPPEVRSARVVESLGSDLGQALTEANRQDLLLMEYAGRKPAEAAA